MRNGHFVIYTKRTITMVSTSILLLVILVLGISSRHGIADQINTWKLLPEPERLTELYFTQHSNLPNSYTDGQTQTVAFTVHNLEYRTTTYTYTITESATGASPLVLSQGKVVLKQNQYAHPSVPIIVSNIGRQAMITVTLTNIPESIAYQVKLESV